MRISCSSGVGWRNVDRFLFFIPSSVKKCGRVVPQNRSILLRPVICRYRRTRPILHPSRANQPCNFRRAVYTNERRMYLVSATGRLLSLLACLSEIVILTNTFAGEANPPPPQSSVRQTSNGLPVLAFPYPAAQQYTVFGATNAAGPYLTPMPGLLVGPTFLVTNPALSGFYRVSATPMSSNDLFSATVLNRLTYGPTPDDLDHIKAVGPEQFIAEQLAAEAIAETIDTDPPITNAPPPPPPLTNWIRVSATGTAAATNCIVYL